jgi:hypothetical protein
MARTDHKSSHEGRDIRVGAILLVGAVLLLVTGLSMLAMKWTFDFLAEREDSAQSEPPSLLRTEDPPPPARPVFQMYPARSLKEFRAAEDRHLSSYGWVDKEGGVAVIPIDRAIDIVAARGLPALEPLNPEEQEGTEDAPETEGESGRERDGSSTSSEAASANRPGRRSNERMPGNE